MKLNESSSDRDLDSIKCKIKQASSSDLLKPDRSFDSTREIKKIKFR